MTDRDYLQLYAFAAIRPDRRNDVLAAARKISAARPRYDAVSRQTGVPWFVLGIIHHMHCGGDFGLTLVTGAAVKDADWEPQSVAEVRASGLRGPMTDVGTIAKCLEDLNGPGYRERGVLSAYLWAWTTVHDAGVFVLPTMYVSGAVPQRPGAMALLKALAEVDAHSVDMRAAPKFAPWAKTQVAKRGRNVAAKMTGLIVAALMILGAAAVLDRQSRARMELTETVAARDLQIAEMEKELERIRSVQAPAAENEKPQRPTRRAKAKSPPKQPSYPNFLPF